MLFGFGPVTDLLLEHGLLDELRLWVHPFLIGSGEPSDLLSRTGGTGSSSSPGDAPGLGHCCSGP